MARETKAALLERQIREQQRWIEEHGATLSGYVARYGSSGDPECYGDGGEAIYEADTAALARLVARRPKKKSPARV